MELPVRGDDCRQRTRIGNCRPNGAFIGLNTGQLSPLDYERSSKMLGVL
jgi:hypothetical protein